MQTTRITCSFTVNKYVQLLQFIFIFIFIFNSHLYSIVAYHMLELYTGIFYYFLPFT
jgi:hypothetical protein